VLVKFIDGKSILTGVHFCNRLTCMFQVKLYNPEALVWIKSVMETGLIARARLLGGLEIG
jgi:hypothetical protein